MDIDTILQGYERFGINLGLEAIEQLLAALGHPQQRVPIIHVAGSNGKGSVCAYLSAMLTQAGYRVGRYTSPHLISWCERICINEQPIAAPALRQVLLQVQAASSASCLPTQFEVITAAMWLYFAQQQVDIAIIEVGLGGRLDATNVCDRPLASIIVSISREHWQRLGATLGQIAYEKAGILKAGCPAVIGQLPAAAQTVVEQRLAALGCPVVYPAPAVALPAEVPAGSRARWVTAQGLRYQLPLLGDIQLHNSALAIAAAKILQQQGWQKLSDAAIAAGIAQTQWPGRLQWVTWQGHRLLIDGAHNAASAQVLRQYVDGLSPSPPVCHWVIGMLSTKDHREVLAALLRSGDRLYLTAVPGHSSAQPADLASLAATVCPDLADCTIYEDVFGALQAATQTKTGLTVLCGSLYLLGLFYQALEDEKNQL